MRSEDFDLKEFNKEWTFICNSGDYPLDSALCSFILKNICLSLTKKKSISRDEIKKMIIGAWIYTYQNPKNVDFSETNEKEGK